MRSHLAFGQDSPSKSFLRQYMSQMWSSRLDAYGALQDVLKVFRDAFVIKDDIAIEQ